jgi:hypothetical protein
MNSIALAALERARGSGLNIDVAVTAPKRFWAGSDVEKLRALYPDTPMPQLVEVFKRPEYSIYNKAHALGLKRSAAYLASEHACRLRREGNPGIGSRFQKGQTSWNKGVSYTAGGRSPETRFAPGTMPHNHVPVGTERITCDGIRQRKTHDDGPAHRRWKSVHMIMWEEAHGELPPGHIVVFRDRNTTNIQIENLELITRAENMRRNTIHRYPPELKLTIRQLGRLKKAISEASNEKQDD